ncbi:MAG TPA: HPr family phosphocarrier protein [Fibrobacteraceae bacterium]|nr:HPr family phosphocarrier protein [Fibrobacteraceae bacterium]
MILRSLTVINKTGIHARPAMAIVEIASRAASSVTLICGGNRANAKSILNLMTLVITPGTQVQFEIDGSDEDEVFQKLEKLFHDRFNEDHYDP